ncbi:MAG TPA: porin, partial [Gemmatimonadota bacterium]|nr:porin [Gemmatimonadota bacterium]
GVDSLHVRANIQPQLDGTTVEDEPTLDWRLRRARIGLRVWAAGWLRGDVEADFGRGRSVLTDAYVRLDFDRAFRFRVGQYKKPFDALELTSSRELPVIERDGTPRGTAGPTPNGLVGDLGYSDRDIGVEWSGSFERFTAAAGIWNGSGPNTSDEDDGKQLAARVGVEVADGWTAAGAWTANRLDVPAPGAVEPDQEWYQAFELALTGGEYGEPGIQALAQLMAGDNHDPGLGGGAEVSFRALQGIVAWHVPLYDSPWLIGWEPAARIGWTDPDSDVDDDEATILTAGVNLYHHARVKTQIGIDRLSPADGDGETAFRVMGVFEF